MIKSILLTSALLLALGAHAQTPADGGPAPTLAPTDTPLDGGASLLLASGVAYGLRRLHQHRRR